MAEKRGLRALPLDGVAPTAEALATGAYPHAKTLFVALGAAPTPLARSFADFLAAPEGQAVLAGIGGFLPPVAAPPSR